MTAKKKDKATVPDVREDGRMLRTDSATDRKELLCVAREFSGPLPPPEMLERYAQISPDILDVLVEMAQKEQTLREKALDATIAENRREQGLTAKGLYLATTIIVLGIAAGCYCAFCGREWAAVAAFGVAGAVGWMKTGATPTADKPECK